MHRIKKIILLFILVNLPIFLFSQYKIVVKGVDNNPVPDAEVSCKRQVLGKTNEEGVLEFMSKKKKVKVNAECYNKTKLAIKPLMEVKLQEKDSGLIEFEKSFFKKKSDPNALAILKKVNKNYKNNAPKSLDSYGFKSYVKISVDFDPDSVDKYNAYITKRIDSVKKLPKRFIFNKTQKIYLKALDIIRLVSESKIFLWEFASDYLYEKKYGEKNCVLDNRVCGLKEPVYEMLTLRSNIDKIPSEIRYENRQLYRYELTDTIEIEGRKNYVIHFWKINFKKPKQSGYIYVDAATYALKKIQTNSRIKKEGNISSVWKLVDGKWFLEKEDLKVKLVTVSLRDKKINKIKTRRKFTTYAYLTARYFDFKTHPETSRSDFKGYTMEVKGSKGDLIEQYRTDSLSNREKSTIYRLDSIGEYYKFDKKLNFLHALTTGKFRAWVVDVDLAKALGENRYEGFRFGLGLKTNYKFNKYISPDVYGAYGLKDKTFKYGVGLDVKTSLIKNAFFRIDYTNDVLSAGKFSDNQWSGNMKRMNAAVNVNNDNFYLYNGGRVAYEEDISNALTLNLSAKLHKEMSGFDYEFKNLGSDFENFSTLITLKYAPKSKNLMTPVGKLTYQRNLPEFYLNYEQGFKTLGGDFNYSRFDMLFISNFKTITGVTGVRLYGGMLLGEAPIWHNFSMNGLGSTTKDINFNFTTYLGFASMMAGKYYNDRFLGYYFTHRLPWYFKTIGQSTSSFDLVYKGAVGDMKNPDYHQFSFEKLNHLYQEVGLEYNDFLSLPFKKVMLYKTTN